MKKTIVMMLAAGSLFTGAAEIGGVRVDDAVKVAGQDLSLNGGGIRYKWGVAKVYVGALYTAQKASNGDAVIADAKPRRISLTLLRNVPTDKLHDSLIDGLEANCSEAELAALQPRIKELNTIFQSVQEVKQGDVLRWTSCQARVRRSPCVARSRM